ncbi:hypothetical protein KDA11_05390 [Candidatus Saccharibacteria bacterium]|nr:hypothetical protein [Candidatus Saccharibacteria bacterium]
MAKFDIPKKDSLAKQLLVTALLLLVVGIVVSLLVKAFLGFILFLLGAIAGIGSQVMANKPFDNKN